MTKCQIWKAKLRRNIWPKGKLLPLWRNARFEAKSHNKIAAITSNRLSSFLPTIFVINSKSYYRANISRYSTRCRILMWPAALLLANIRTKKNKRAKNNRKIAYRKHLNFFDNFKKFFKRLNLVGDGGSNDNRHRESKEWFVHEWFVSDDNAAE